MYAFASTFPRLEHTVTDIDQVILDTGSSDTWLIKKDFRCVNEDLEIESESYCDFGPTFNGSFQGGQIANVSRNPLTGGKRIMT